MKLGLFQAASLALLLSGCQARIDEATLISQLEGGECRWLDTESNSSFARAVHWSEERPAVNCQKVRFYDWFFVDHYKENCIVSGAKCMLTFPALSPTAVQSLETFLLTGPNDVNTGDGTKSIRGTVAGVYARLGGANALEVLEKAYERNDPLGISSQASGVGLGGLRGPRTNGEIENAIDFVKAKRSHNQSRDADAMK